MPLPANRRKELLVNVQVEYQLQTLSRMENDTKLAFLQLAFAKTAQSDNEESFGLGGGGGQAGPGHM